MKDKEYGVDQTRELEKILGYLNFSNGRSDPSFQRSFVDLYEQIAEEDDPAPWHTLADRLSTHLKTLQREGSTTFRDARQAEAVLRVCFDLVLPKYRDYHSDLLFHLDDKSLFQPFFIVRAIESTLESGPLRDDEGNWASDVVRHLSDYVGHRPIAILETRPRNEPYAHERIRPIPLYIRDAGVAPGIYREVVLTALSVLEKTDASLLHDAQFEFDHLEELAFDPRAYDFSHPVNRRPNYVFGEWDPDLIHNKGHFCRFVVRQVVLDALLDRIEQEKSLPRQELVFEAAVVLACTMLMGSGIRGGRPDTYDSSVTLATLLPHIARYRDAFYEFWFRRLEAEHAIRLQAEAESKLQPFGGARQALNQYLTRKRAYQLQQRHLAAVMAELGYPDAAREELFKEPTASGRIETELHICLTTGKRLLERQLIEQALVRLLECEEWLKRGIDCGALADPWNVLGFARLFPLFSSSQDSVRDHRIDQMIDIVEAMFDLYGRVLSRSAAAGNRPLAERTFASMQDFSNWWDRFAIHTIGDDLVVHGGQATTAARTAANALRQWYDHGQKLADLAFWNQAVGRFPSARSYTLVLDALLEKNDFHASMGLLMHWLSTGEETFLPLQEGDESFHTAALRWMLSIAQACRDPETRGQRRAELQALVPKFFDYLEANAGDYWSVPRLEMMGIPLEETVEDMEQYREEMEDFVEEVQGFFEQYQPFEETFDESEYGEDDDSDSGAEVLEVGPDSTFELELEEKRIEEHLRFHRTLARLWYITARTIDWSGGPQEGTVTQSISSWLKQARENLAGLLSLLDAIHEYPIPEPTGTYESMIEYDRRRTIKERLLHAVIGCGLEAWNAAAALRSRKGPPKRRRTWRSDYITIDHAMWQGDTEMIRQILPRFLEDFRGEPLLFEPLLNGGHPRRTFRANRAHAVLRSLAGALPRLGLLEEAFLVTKSALATEWQRQANGPAFTEFAKLFQVACQRSVEAIIDSAGDELDSHNVFLLVGKLLSAYMPLWRAHSRTLRVSSLEMITNEAEWGAVRQFIERYGGDLFTAQFATYGNLRAILHQGVEAWLEQLCYHADPIRPPRIVGDLDRLLDRDEAVKHIETIIRALLENYDVYKDYNSVAAQSDYGENLWILLDFLRLRAAYDRRAWQFRPLLLTHEVLARKKPEVAELWREQFSQLTQAQAAAFLKRVSQLEQLHGLRLNTVREHIEEQFVRPMLLDRVCAAIEPMIAAVGTPDQASALGRFRDLLQPCVETPTGAGLDVPSWLRRIEAALNHVETRKTDVGRMVEELLQLPVHTISLTNLHSQLENLLSGQDDIWDELRSAFGGDE